jgi:predicted membrane protein
VKYFFIIFDKCRRHRTFIIQIKTMKMGAGIFWGSILIILGISLILRIFFDISVFRIIIAFLLIFIGIKMLVGKKIFSSLYDENNVFFGERVFKSTPQNNTDYNTLFSETTYDFREMDSLTALRTKISIKTVFGNTVIILPRNLNVQVKAEAVFASASLPNGNTIAFGSTNYNSENYNASSPLLIIDVNVVFGNVEIRQ